MVYCDGYIYPTRMTVNYDEIALISPSKFSKNSIKIKWTEIHLIAEEISEIQGFIDDYLEIHLSESDLILHLPWTKNLDKFIPDDFIEKEART